MTYRYKDQLDKSDTRSENDHHKKVARWLNRHGIVWFHVPNETGAMKAKSKHAFLAHRKAMGVASGIPDILIITPPPKYPLHCGAALELKRADGGRPTDNQNAWLTKFADLGWATGVAHGFDNAIIWLENLGYGETK